MAKTRRKMRGGVGSSGFPPSKPPVSPTGTSLPITFGQSTSSSLPSTFGQSTKISTSYPKYLQYSGQSSNNDSGESSNNENLIPVKAARRLSNFGLSPRDPSSKSTFGSSSSSSSSSSSVLSPQLSSPPSSVYSIPFLGNPFPKSSSSSKRRGSIGHGSTWYTVEGSSNNNNSGNESNIGSVVGLNENNSEYDAPSEYDELREIYNREEQWDINQYQNDNYTNDNQALDKLLSLVTEVEQLEAKEDNRTQTEVTYEVPAGLVDAPTVDGKIELAIATASGISKDGGKYNLSEVLNFFKKMYITFLTEYVTPGTGKIPNLQDFIEYYCATIVSGSKPSDSSTKSAIQSDLKNLLGDAQLGGAKKRKVEVEATETKETIPQYLSRKGITDIMRTLGSLKADARAQMELNTPTEQCTLAFKAKQDETGIPFWDHNNPPPCYFCGEPILCRGVYQKDTGTAKVTKTGKASKITQKEEVKDNWCRDCGRMHECDHVIPVGPMVIYAVPPITKETWAKLMNMKRNGTP